MFFKRAKRPEEAAAPVPAAATAAAEASTVKHTKDPLSAEVLRRETDAARLGFKSTADLARTPPEPFEARRVWDALDTAIKNAPAGARPHVLISVPPQCGASSAVAAHVAGLPQATDKAAPDWIIVRSEGTAKGWSALAVPFSQGKRLAAGLDAVIAQLRNTLPYLLASEDLARRRATIEAGYAAVRDDAFARLHATAQAQNVAVLSTPMGYAVAPIHEGKVVKPEVLARLPQAMRDDVRRKVEAVETELQALLAEVPSEASGQVNDISELVADYVRPAIAIGFEGLAKEFSDNAPVMSFLATIEEDILRRARRDGAALALPEYHGRVLDGRAQAQQAADRPLSAEHLLERLLQAGTGTVVLNSADLESLPGARAALDLAMETRAIALADLGDQRLPMAAQVVLVKETAGRTVADVPAPRASRFQVVTSFAEETARSEESEATLARLIAAATQDRSLLPLEAAAVAHLIGEAARTAGRPDRLSGDLTQPLALAAAANRTAASASRKSITEADVRAAVADRREGGSVQSLFAAPSAQVVGRVLALGLAAKPVEVWATVRPGRGTAADIARASGGSDTASTATATLWSLLSSRYVPAGPLSLAAALVHEPPIAGDAAVRASAAEVCALLSALAEAPVAASFAVAGWASPSGALVPIPDINDAIEAAFADAGSRDATDPLNIVIPRGNVADLMLRADLVEAARKGKLRVFAAADIDEAMALITSIPSGQRTDAVGEPSLNRQIDERLAAFARQQVAAEPQASAQRAKAGAA